MKKPDPFSLLCQCLRNSDGQQDHSARLKKVALDGQTDWYAVVRLADYHFVSTILYYQLERKGLLSLLPEDLQEVLVQIYDLNTKRNALIYDEINVLASLLNPAGIEPVFLKGSAGLLMDINEAPGLRIMNDVDLLVDEKDLPTCVALMEEKGYYPMKEVNLPDDFYHLTPYVHDSHNIRFELHKRLEKDRHPQVDSKEILEQSVMVKVKDGTVRVPSMEHFVLHNILHHQLFNSGLFTEQVLLYQLYDLYAVREKYEQLIDWKSISTFFKDHAYPDALYYPLGLLRNYFKQPPPVAIPFLPARMFMIRGKRLYTRFTTSWDRT